MIHGRFNAKVFEKLSELHFQSVTSSVGHKAPCCVWRWSFTAVVMGLSVLRTQSSKYDHRILWQMTSAQPKGNKERPQSYWLRQHSLVCLCRPRHFSALDDTPQKIISDLHGGSATIIHDCSPKSKEVLSIIQCWNNCLHLPFYFNEINTLRL